ncbi:5-formyltetrahydrofolate cyclo-ligase [Clostridium polyendosporum]|uniref:5-formyltetrahydrofolate cyclo-ligase n=1 Tax=Clostridium polyendosporum TaxID=69208 RepID=A0A919RZA5_9CLOT|nr:5-formyltetrahydrofolate cyclo-ligase [Clostridium polyendosporum]GIM28549.1 5-formyltetrahydrofolate cyclo-ligase [Clostridium polyendosporum]
MDKSEIRNIVIAKRKELSKVAKDNFDNIISRKFLNSEIYKQCKTIFIYISMNEEIDTKTIILKALEEGKRVCVPKIDIKNRVMKAVEIKNLSQMVETPPFGILEPPTFDLKLDIDEIELIVVPGLAFDKNGGRVGYGGGYYDKFLFQPHKSKKIVLAYDFQVFESVPVEKHDVRVDYVITEKQAINCKE